MAKSKKARMPVEAVCGPSRLTAQDKARQRQYEVEDGLRTMQRAGELVKDKALMKDIKAFAKEQIANLNKVAK